VLKTVVAVIETQIGPAVAAPHARASLLLIAGLLDNLASRVEEATETRTEKQDLVDALAATVPVALEAGPGVTRPGTPAPVPQAARWDEERRISSALRALRRDPALYDAPGVRTWVESCQSALARCTSIEIGLMRPTRYFTSQSGERA
jgi:hypothetical protein